MTTIREVHMVEESKRVDQVREERVRDSQKEPVKPKPKETDFDKILEKSQLASKMTQTTQSQSKLLTEEAIKEAAKHEERQGDDRKRDDDRDSKGDRDSHQKGERAEGGPMGGVVVAKGKLTQDSGGGGGGHEGYGGGNSKKDMARLLNKSQAKSLPLDLQNKFAQKLTKAVKDAQGPSNAVLSQQIINKLVQYVRIGMNRKGEKELHMDLHEEIFKGLKLRVTARGGKKVGVHFMLADAKGRELFNKNSDAIREALEKKGIEVDEILVS